MYRIFNISVVTFSLLFLICGLAIAEPAKEQNMDYMKPYEGSPELEKIKSLSGTWTGTGMMNGKEVPMTVEYKTTAGGSAVIETLSPGTPMEMVSIYYEEDGKLVMKHFCMLKNQPVLGIKKSDGSTIEFDLIDGTNMDASKDMHMHSATFTFLDDNTMTQTWTPYQGGKPLEGTNTVTLSRVN